MPSAVFYGRRRQTARLFSHFQRWTGSGALLAGQRSEEKKKEAARQFHSNFPAPLRQLLPGNFYHAAAAATVTATAAARSQTSITKQHIPQNGMWQDGGRRLSTVIRHVHLLTSTCRLRYHQPLSATLVEGNDHQGCHQDMGRSRRARLAVYQHSRANTPVPTLPYSLLIAYGGDLETLALRPLPRRRNIPRPNQTRPRSSSSLV